MGPAAGAGGHLHGHRRACRAFSLDGPTEPAVPAARDGALTTVVDTLAFFRGMVAPHAGIVEECRR
jgi:hypothetical protein